MGDKMIDKANQIARKEWENLRDSFEMCGDIGDFNPEDFRTPRWFFGEDYNWFIPNVLEMDRGFAQYGYATPEALNTFTVLASRAAEKLGLNKMSASAFGMGYGFLRTGLIEHNRLESKQVLFYKMFFPLGVSIDWNSDPSLVKEKLHIVFERFKDWQNNPQHYTRDFAESQETGEIWEEWEEINE
jgi:hypothetical protein